ncbi:hypothetical protein FEM48_ZijujUnG0099000 [Ziziphus jujuba var. spinosa]|uniref:Uncharacterized protein n=1 Tax=Ziziphus jujuba var. spinosa TaxID=714518 RepID=A0A978U8A9_ZIZJJ|nr:hypothetical protein FEM48_ZijujUnG0099000 [Ziziphus jujuba var. spinosa]
MEARANEEKTNKIREVGFYIDMLLALEAGSDNKENERLKQEADKEEEEEETASFSIINPHLENPFEEEYESFGKDGRDSNPLLAPQEKDGGLKILKELEAANAKIGEFRNGSRLQKDELEFKERTILSQEALIKGFKMELKNANDLASKLSSDFEMHNNDTAEAKAETYKGKRSRSTV